MLWRELFLYTSVIVSTVAGGLPDFPDLPDLEFHDPPDLPDLDFPDLDFPDLDLPDLDLPDTPGSGAGCRAPGNPSFCEESSEHTPVSCGGPHAPPHDLCTYESVCHAEQANYLACECCPMPDPSLASSGGSPVYCGENACLYDNEDLAINAGWRMDDCLPEEPVCPKSCGECEYTVDPVSCGENSCNYKNMCLAVAAGFEEEDCILGASSKTGTDCETEDTDATQKVTCGRGKDTFDNMCTAIKEGGFSHDDCCPKFVGGCKRERNPERMECSNVHYSGCRYRNKCIAETVGFVVELECKVLEKIARNP